MNLTFTNADRAFQEEVREWLATAWPEAARKRQARSALQRISKEEQIRWQKALAAKGWAAIDWPTEYGGAGFTATQAYIFDLEKARAGAPRVLPFGMSMVAPVIMRFGTDEQKRRFLPDIRESNVWWCQGYSEPGSGSDLASLRTRAEDRGDHFVVNGQKTWTTLAQHADWIFCLVRSSQEAKPQLGISFLLIDMRSPGVTVQPIITLDQPAPGFQEINSVFFDNVVVPKANLIGEAGKGWTYAKYLLEFERGNAYSPTLKEALAQIRTMASVERGDDGSAIGANVAFKARVDAVEVQILALEFTELRILGALAAGQNVGPESSLLKTRGTELQQAVTELAVEVVGYYANPFDASTPLPGDNFRPVGPEHANGVAQEYFNTRKVSIFAGSNEIQRNIMAKLVLGLT